MPEAISLYVHIPWCVQKCPYCDFNSHSLKSKLPESEYVSHLLQDLADEATLVGERAVQSIFIGGGTPSLFSPEAIDNLLRGISNRVNVAADAEITLEANPGTLETDKFCGFAQAGINRISIGVQSFQTDKLKALGRIHDGNQAQNAAIYAREAGLKSFNLDLMHGLPNQSLSNALGDLRQAIGQQPPHLSWYQLTLEPNTPFYTQPPPLPTDDTLWDIQDQGHELLTQAGYEQYEISAYCQTGMQCQHNLNYWRFGDYIGIGCGAHGKITKNNHIQRRVKIGSPKAYMDLTRPYLHKKWCVEPEDLPFEFFMNRLRLLEPCPTSDFERLTGRILPSGVKHNIKQAIDKGLLCESPHSWQLTELGKRYLNHLLETLV